MTERVTMRRLTKVSRDQYRHILPIVGAGIVLVTFVVKDELRDHLRDVVDAVKQAETIHFIRGDSEAILSMLGNIYQRVRYPNDQDRDIDLIASDNSYQAYLVVVRIQRQVANTVELISPLVESLSHQEVNKQHLSDLANRLESVRDALTNIESSMNTGAFSKTEVHDIPPNLLPDFQRVKHDTSMLANEVRKLDESLLQEAKVARQNAEFWNRVWSFLSVALFAAGWGLGLIGQMFGLRV